MAIDLSPEQVDLAYRRVFRDGGDFADVVLADLMDRAGFLKVAAGGELPLAQVEGMRALVLHILERAGMTLLPVNLPSEGDQGER